MKINYEKLALDIRRHLAEKNITAKKFAENCGLSAATISRFRNGTQRSGKDLYSIMLIANELKKELKNYVHAID